MIISVYSIDWLLFFSVIFLSRTQSLSPHPPHSLSFRFMKDFALFKEGSRASDEIKLMAEDGNNSELLVSFFLGNSFWLLLAYCMLRTFNTTHTSHTWIQTQKIPNMHKYSYERVYYYIHRPMIRYNYLLYILVYYMYYFVLFSIDYIISSQLSTVITRGHVRSMYYDDIKW